MTCIVGLRHKGSVYIGADSAAVSGDHVEARRDKKVFVRGPYVIGGAGSFRAIDLLQYVAELPVPIAKVDLRAFMCSHFVDALRQCYKTAGSLQRDDGIEGIHGAFLVGVRGRLFELSYDLQVGEHYTPYSAIGCGAVYALGAMHAMHAARGARKPKQMVLTALGASARFCGGVRAPFVVRSV